MQQARQPLALAVLVSGNGSNLQAIIDQIEAGNINARIVCVISNKENAFALSRAAKHGIPAHVLSDNTFSSRREFDAELVKILKSNSVDLVVLAGFMRILTDVVIDTFPKAIINIHPSLLPAFPGLNPQRQALEHGVKFTGCTVHFVDCGTDTGPIIIQACVPVLDDDTVDSLSRRILNQEHEVLPRAIHMIATGKLTFHGRRVITAGCF